MSKRKYKKELREGNTNMDYDLWKLWNKILKNQTFDYNMSWYKND